MIAPLSEQALRDCIRKLVFNYSKPDGPNLGEAADEITDLVLQDRKAWGEYVIGEDCTEIGGCTDCAEDNGYYDNVHNELRAEQRQRNQGEKTDE